MTASRWRESLPRHFHERNMAISRNSPYLGYCRESQFSLFCFFPQLSRMVRLLGRRPQVEAKKNLAEKRPTRWRGVIASPLNRFMISVVWRASSAPDIIAQIICLKVRNPPALD